MSQLSSCPRRCALITLIACAALGFALGSATAAQAQPGFSKAFLPDTIGPGSTTQLRFEINNSESATLVTGIAFSDTLPAGVVIATPASVFTDCVEGVLSAPDGGSTISLSGARLGANRTCSVTVNVTSSVPGSHMNVSGNLTSSAGSSGTATATLTVTTARPGFSKSFSPSSIPLGGTSTLTLTIDNTANAASLFSLNFNDALPAGMVIATPANAATDCFNAAIPPTFSAASGTSTITLFSAGMSPGFPVLIAGASCTVTVDVTTTAAGLFTNTSGELSSGTPSVSSGFATAALGVPAGFLAKSFIDDPVVPGGSVTLRFSITNLDRDQPATSIAFDDDLDSVLAGLAPGETLPKAACGGTVSFAAGTLSFSGGSLAAGGSCTFTVLLDVPPTAPGGAFINITDPITALIGGGSVIGNTATDTLLVSLSPTLTKEFIDDPVTGGGTVTLRFTLTNNDPDTDAVDIAFTDDLETALLGLAANSLVVGGVPAPLVDICGDGSELTITTIPLGGGGLLLFPTVLELTGGSLAPAGSPGDSCTFDVVLDVPANVPSGTYLNTTSNLTGQIDTCGDGCLEPFTGLPASGELVVVGAPHLAKAFTDDPTVPGGTVTLEFTLSYPIEAPGTATAITFTDDLVGTTGIAGLAANNTPRSDLCGGGSLLAGTTTLSFTGGTLAPGESCTFSVTLDVPLATTPGTVTNQTSTVTAMVAGLATTSAAATADLRIAGLVLSKEFIDDPVLPGDTGTLRFTLNNFHPTDDATNITFTDNLSLVLGTSPGLTAVAPLPDTSSCGAGSSLTGTTFLTFTGGSVDSGMSCSFDVTVAVPAGTVNDSYNNVTSALTATLGGSSFIGDPATDALIVDSNLLFLTKEFTDDPVAPGGTVTLAFTLTNLDDTHSITGIAFSDDLDAVLTGLAAVPPLSTGTCGGTLGGTSVLSYSGGSLAPGASCSMSVTVSVPSGGALSTTVTNTTSSITGTADGLPITGDPASDDLQIDTLLFTKAFDGPAVVGDTVTLSFTIHNLDAMVGVSNLSFVDNLGAVLSGLAATGLPASDVCGAGSLLSGTTLLTLDGASLLPGGSCTFEVEVAVPAGATPGTYTNTTSDLEQTGLPVASPAVADLEVLPEPVTCFTGPTATGAGDAMICISGGGAACGFSQVAFIPLEGAPLSPPAGTSPTGIAFPFGLVAFTLDTCTPGFTADVTLTLPFAPPQGTQYWKYGPTLDDPAPHWYVYPATFSGNVITFSVTDGGAGDHDLMEDGSIVDPSGPGALAPSVVEIPTLGTGSLLLLAALLALFAVAVLRRRSQRSS